MTTKKADVYACEAGHEFAVIHKEPQGDVIECVTLTIPCPFGDRELAHYRGSIDAELKLTDKQKAEGWG